MVTTLEEAARQLGGEFTGWRAASDHKVCWFLIQGRTYTVTLWGIYADAPPVALVVSSVRRVLPAPDFHGDPSVEVVIRPV